MSSFRGRWLAAFYAVAGAAYSLYARLGARFSKPAQRRVWAERLAESDRPETGELPQRTIWVQAASVGEVQVARPLLRWIREIYPHVGILLTCNTVTGRRIAEGLDVDEVAHFPVDTRGVISTFLGRRNIGAFISIETELWPTLLGLCADLGIATAMVNARVSERSFPRYLKVRELFEPGLRRMSAIAARDAESAKRLIELGAEPSRTATCGDLKLDAIDTKAVAETPRLLSESGVTRPCVIAISTHEGEDEAVLEAFAEVCAKRPETALVLAPRHPDRSDDVEALARRYGAVSRWSDEERTNDWDVLVVDQTGILRGFMSDAVAGFVGGSWGDIGGHNLLEPAAYGLPVATGPSLSNVSDQAEAFRSADSLFVVDGAQALALAWIRWLEDPALAAADGERAAGVVEAGRGSMRAVAQLLAPVLDQATRES